MTRLPKRIVVVDIVDEMDDGIENEDSGKYGMKVIYKYKGFNVNRETGDTVRLAKPPAERHLTAVASLLSNLLAELCDHNPEACAKLLALTIPSIYEDSQKHCGADGQSILDLIKHMNIDLPSMSDYLGSLFREMTGVKVKEEAVSKPEVSGKALTDTQRALLRISKSSGSYNGQN